METTEEIKHYPMFLHTLLYAKGHYKIGLKENKQHSFSMHDLKIIVGEHSLMLPEHVSSEHILCFVNELSKMYSRRKPDILEIVTKASRDYSTMPFTIKHSITIEDIINVLLSDLRFVEIKYLPPLPQADPTLLPIPVK